jgi:hypothetical protein
MDETEEPLRQLSRDEFERLRAEIVASRGAAATESPIAQKQSLAEPAPASLPGSAGAIPSTDAVEENAQVMETGAAIWELRKRGFSTYEVSRRLAIPLQSVNEILERFEAVFYGDVANAMQRRANLDTARLEELIRAWYPTAVAGPIETTRVDKHGNVHRKLDVETPFRASTAVLQAIVAKAKIMQASRTDDVGVNGKDGSTPNLLVWLQSALPSVSRVVRQIDDVEVPRERLILECEAEVDIKSSHTNGSNGSPR